ncbi:hypothetical protein [Nocardia fusca]|uniref:hypothetical protein n=1 Tax=Nocardia fusca TaxID=941183 RepID=UPI0007A74133|nr:hypothetical protein [Nocardia fusca]
MSDQFQTSTDGSGWKARLLNRIRYHYAHEHKLAVRDTPRSEGSQPALLWGGRGHRNITDYHARIEELETRAAAAGLPEAALASARAAGIADRPLASKTPDDAASEDLEPTEVLADRIWRLRHTALVVAEYDIRSSDHDLRADLATITEAGRNMDALWIAVTADIASADLSVEEAIALWDLDEQGWRHCGRLVHNYDDTVLRHRLDESASPEIRTQLATTLTEHSPDRIAHAIRLGIAPPEPIPLSETATQALLTLHRAAELPDQEWSEGLGFEQGQDPSLSAPEPPGGPDL